MYRRNTNTSTPYTPTYRSSARSFQSTQPFLQPTARSYTPITAPSHEPTSTPNCNGHRSIFALVESDFQAPFRSTPLRNPSTLLRSNSLNSLGNLFRDIATNSNPNNGGLFGVNSSSNSNTLHRANSISGDKAAHGDISSPNTGPIFQPFRPHPRPSASQGYLSSGNGNTNNSSQLGESPFLSNPSIVAGSAGSSIPANEKL
ncbi:hypothetical protein N431DRAFT_447910 [Stipitochalara longipes BDJ]|nr:hypothetical protein N431DRAFT_447910 [Stipitochalara longipes BDJ]